MAQDTSAQQTRGAVANLMVIDFKMALFGGAVAVGLAIAGVIVVGRVGPSEGKLLLQAMVPTTRFLCSAVMTGSATILALMMTLLGLGQSSSHSLKRLHYRRVSAIAFVDTATFVGATMLLLFHSIPIEDSEKIPPGWYDGMYYALLSATALIGGMLITTMLMLYRTVRDMIFVVGGIDGRGLVEEQVAEESSAEESSAEEDGG